MTNQIVYIPAALETLWKCGLSPDHYDTIEKAAEGVFGLVQTLRGMLSDPTPDICQAVLKKLNINADDTERLNWLEQQCIVELSKKAGYDCWKISSVNDDDYPGGPEFDGDLRAAIDSAMDRKEGREG